MTKRIPRDGKGGAELRNETLHANLPIYTVATLPTPSNAIQGRLIFVSDGATNKRIGICDGAAWRFPDGAVVS